MSGDRVYPDESAGPFEAPPLSFVDGEDRDIEIRPYPDDADGESGEDEFEALVEMYTAFDPADRAQGIPPGRESDVRSWLETILGDDGYNVVAWDGDTVAELPDGTVVERYDDLPPIEGVAGDPDALPHYAGQSAGTTDAVEPAGDVVRSLVATAAETIERASGAVGRDR